MDPNFFLCWRSEAGREYRLPCLVQAVDQLPVGEEHHLGAGHVEGVAPVPAVVQKVAETVELCLDYGELSPSDTLGLQEETEGESLSRSVYTHPNGRVDEGPGILGTVTLQQSHHRQSEGR